MAQPSVAEHYRERYVVPWWFWPVGFLAAVAFGALFDGPLSASILTWPIYAGLVALTWLGLWRIGHLRVSVTDDEFRVDDARLPRRFIATVEELSPAAKRRLLSVDAHPFAFVVQRGWIRGTVRVTLDDPADPTPYWVISTRHPDRLIAALTADRDHRVPDDGPRLRAGTEGNSADGAAARS